MAETVPGGRYQRADGVFVDANGNVLDQEVEREAPTAAASPAVEPVASPVKAKAKRPKRR